MIEVTDEMKLAFRAAQERRVAELIAMGAPLGAHDILDQGLAAVLAVVERDHAALCGVPGPDGLECERPVGHSELHGCVGIGELVLW